MYYSEIGSPQSRGARRVFIKLKYIICVLCVSAVSMSIQEQKETWQSFLPFVVPIHLPSAQLWKAGRDEVGIAPEDENNDAGRRKKSAMDNISRCA